MVHYRSCEDHETETGVLGGGKEGKGEEGEGLDPVYSDQSEIERAVKNATSPSSSGFPPCAAGFFFEVFGVSFILHNA